MKNSHLQRPVFSTFLVALALVLVPGCGKPSSPTTAPIAGFKPDPPTPQNVSTDEVTNPRSAVEEGRIIETSNSHDSAMLESTLIEFVRTMRRDSSDVAKSIDVLERSSPRKEDMAVIFPEQYEQLWELLQLGLAKMRQRVADGETPPAPGWDAAMVVKPINCRTDESKRFDELFKMIPAEIPLYRVVIHSEKKRVGGGSSSYLFVNDHWVYWPGIEQMPREQNSIPDKIKDLREALAE